MWSTWLVLWMTGLLLALYENALRLQNGLIGRDTLSSHGVFMLSVRKLGNIEIDLCVIGISLCINVYDQCGFISM